MCCTAAIFDVTAVDLICAENTRSLIVRVSGRQKLAHLNAHPIEAIRPLLPSLDRSSAETAVPDATGLTADYDLNWILGAITDQAAPRETGRSDVKVASKTRTVPSWSDVKARLAQFDRAGLISAIFTV